MQLSTNKANLQGRNNLLGKGAWSISKNKLFNHVGLEIG
jgi:hypothetical protein